MTTGHRISVQTEGASREYGEQHESRTHKCAHEPAHHTGTATKHALPSYGMHTHCQYTHRDASTMNLNNDTHAGCPPNSTFGTHTHTYTHRHTHRHTHTHTHTQTQTQTHTHTHTYTHTYTHIHTHIHTHTHTHTYLFSTLYSSVIPTHTHTHTQIHIHNHTYASVCAISTRGRRHGGYSTQQYPRPFPS